jgi:hypothetical protein
MGLQNITEFKNPTKFQILMQFGNPMQCHMYPTGIYSLKQFTVIKGSNS